LQDEQVKTKKLLDDLGLSKQELEYFKSKADKLQQENNKLMDQIGQFGATGGVPGNPMSSVLTFGGGFQQSSLLRPDDDTQVKQIMEENMRLKREALASDSNIRDLKDSHLKETSNLQSRISELETQIMNLRTENSQLKSGGVSTPTTSMIITPWID
jgi:hypothetical protein